MKKLAYILLLPLITLACKKNTTTSSAKDIVSKKMLDAYTQVQYGNMPLIISVPHGGLVAPTTLSDRVCPNSTTVTDSKTIELANAIDSVFKNNYNVQPYIVLSFLKRTKLDQNRPLDEATCNNANLFTFWNNYHLSIDTCVTKILDKYSNALFIDLHGHGHTNQRLELGYLIPRSGLQNTSTINTATTSVTNLWQQNTSLPFTNLITGVNAFGTLMQNSGYASVPSQQDPTPLNNDLYFDGGYNTQRYTSTTNPKVYGWQVEANFTGVRDNNTNIANFAKAFADNTMRFYSLNTNLQPSNFGR
jgi:N-formylglutamate amidohydrolase